MTAPADLAVSSFSAFFHPQNFSVVGALVGARLCAKPRAAILHPLFRHTPMADDGPSAKKARKSKVALITGIPGQDGSYLAELLLKKSYEVHGIIRRSSSFNTGRIEDLYQARTATRATSSCTTATSPTRRTASRCPDERRAEPRQGVEADVKLVEKGDLTSCRRTAARDDAVLAAPSRSVRVLDDREAYVERHPLQPRTRKYARGVRPPSEARSERLRRDDVDDAPAGRARRASPPASRHAPAFRSSASTVAGARGRRE